MLQRKITVLVLLAAVLAFAGTVVSTESDAAGTTTSDGIVYTLQGESAVISGYVGDQSVINIPAEVEIDGVMCPVVSVLDSTNPFRDYSAVTSFAVDPSNSYLKSIDGVLFNAAGSMLLAYPAGSSTTSYAVPDNVMAIAKYAFKGCSSLQEIQLGSGIVRVPDYAFSGCVSLEAVGFTNHVAAIGEHAFSGCTSLACIDMPSSVTKVERSAFRDCSSLSDVELSGNLTWISADVFRGCTSLVTISLPASLASIYENVFLGCYSLAHLHIVCDGLVTVAPTAFCIGDSSQSVECYVNCSTPDFDPRDHTDQYTAIHFNEESFTLRIHSEGSVSTYDLMCGEPLDMDLPQKTGYQIRSWTDGHGNTVTFPKRMPATDLDLYAVWDAVSYSIIFHSNDGTGRTYTQSVKYDRQEQLVNSRYSQQHMCFTGWRDSSDKHYDNEEYVMNLSTGEDFNLYAEWTPPDYIIHYESSIGEGEMEDQPLLNGAYHATYRNGFSAPGYVFFGWDGSDGNEYFNGQNVKDLGTDGTVITFTAKWEPIRYVVYYDLQGGSSSSTVNPTIATFGESYSVPQGITKSGHILVGWSLDKNTMHPEILPGGQFADLTDVDGKNLTLYAIWYVNVYTVFYHANGGNGTMDHQFVVYGSTADLARCTFTKVYSNFVGWALSPDGVVVYGDGSQLPGNLFPENNSLNLYAVWENWKYVIHFDANGGEGSMSDLLTECNTEIQLPSCGFTSDTSFKGWSLTPGGKVEYSDKALATNISRGASEVTLYAVWVIPVDDDGGSDNMAFIVAGAAVVILVIIAGAAVFFRKH